MRLLIAGWHGQLARALIETAPGEPDVDALAAGRPALDLCEPASITRAMTDFRPDVIINTAAYTAVDKAEAEPAAAFALNRDGARLLAAAARKRGAAIIHVSTDYVFDGAKSGAYVEDDATAPLNIYGRSKLDGEAAVRAEAPRHVIVRTARVYSAGGQNFVRRMLEAARAGTPVRVVDDQIGSPTYAPHLADVVLAIARRITKDGAASPWGTYHAAGSGAASWCELAREAFRVSVASGGPAVAIAPIASADYPTTAPRPLRTALDCGKLQRTFGIALPPWQAGVAAAVPRTLARAAARP